MNNEAIKKITHRGLTIEIFQDMDAQSPDEWENTDMFLVAFDSRNFYIQREGYDVETCRQLASKPADRDEEYRDACKRIEKDYHIFGLEAYIHSGVSLALSQEGNFPDRRWDVSQLGLVFVSKKDIARTRDKAHKAAKSLIEEWNQYLGGDVYGYVVNDAEGKHLNSCWGFYGTDAVIEAAKEAADHEADRIIREHVAKKKAEIKNHVPLSKRTVLSA